MRALARPAPAKEALDQVGQPAKTKVDLRGACVDSTSDKEDHDDKDREDLHRREHRGKVALAHQVDEGRSAQGAKSAVD